LFSIVLLSVTLTNVMVLNCSTKLKIKTLLPYTFPSFKTLQKWHHSTERHSTERHGAEQLM